MDEGSDKMATDNISTDGVTLPGGTDDDMEGDALRLIVALDAVAAIDADAARNTERYQERLRFALRRVDELRHEAKAEGGVFTSARLEIAFSILETHVQTSAAYVNRVVKRARRVPGRSTVRATVDEAVAAIETRADAA